MKFTLLSKGSSNAKLAKDSAKGVENYILYLSPFTQNNKGINLCPKASPTCAKACLFSAGRGAFSNVAAARIRKSNYLLSDRIGFLKQLWAELSYINTNAGKRFIKAAVRLNGTSDLDFPKLFSLINVDLFSLENIVFYDYTKVLTRLIKYKDLPYSLTFSRSEINAAECETALKLGFNVAVVFSSVPNVWNRIKVINGDESDLRFNDECGVIVGLKAKGKARQDKSGFVVLN